MGMCKIGHNKHNVGKTIKSNHYFLRVRPRKVVIFFLQLVFFEPFEKVYFSFENSRPLRTKNSSSAPTIPTSYQSSNDYFLPTSVIIVHDFCNLFYLSRDEI